VPYHVPGAVDGDELELIEGHRVTGLVQRVLRVRLGQPLVPVSGNGRCVVSVHRTVTVGKPCNSALTSRWLQ
jgi:hypothetical protein